MNLTELTKFNELCFHSRKPIRDQKSKFNRSITHSLNRSMNCLVTCHSLAKPEPGEGWSLVTDLI
jgi:hypothetical protein